MTWLTLWLKKIILLVLLAAFLDLILPNTTLQRYVKMVMGLILLLTIISPVFSLFSLSQEDLAFRLDRYQQQLNKPADAEWKRITDKLLGQQDAQMTAYVQAQVEAGVKAQVKEAYGVEVQEVAVVVNKKDSEQPKLARIELVLGGSVQEQKEGQNPIKPVTPIQPVEINLGEKATMEPRQEIEAAARQNNPMLERISDDIAEQWGLTRDQVVVRDEIRAKEKQ
ncbi:stage III sporulation protein AF [Brevibacillus sp. NRS-1366]|uniref:stage III sporulation protein AF n=1 Tax=Brevibacillus sp. NRS-1366 TaxID=3233899 RepID=UPI003D20DD7D